MTGLNRKGLVVAYLAGILQSGKGNRLREIAPQTRRDSAAGDVVASFVVELNKEHPVLSLPIALIVRYKWIRRARLRRIQTNGGRVETGAREMERADLGPPAGSDKADPLDMTENEDSKSTENL
ncbi:hypothetical protein BC826DRAFT_968769 [Russula brevipes]|nr:hypothetical protein BC826DRAFT_974527 [Russula brevipes]KAI0294587.1 hypothetical protein BC826DRAFT_968769 [Russula brevipes]